MQVQHYHPSVTVIAPGNTIKTTNPSAPPPKVANTDRSRRFNFEEMTCGELYDAVNELYEAGEISIEEASDVTLKYEWVFPGLAPGEWRNMPARISFDELREDIATCTPGSAAGDKAWLERVLDIMQRFDGKARHVDVSA
jgi:hypothetical protein